MRKVISFVCLLVLFSVSACNEGSVRKTEFERIDIKDRIDFQQNKLNQLIGSGSLSPGAADVLQDNLEWIRSEHSRMKADGRFTMAERDELGKLLDANSRMLSDRGQGGLQRLRQ